MSDHYNGIPPLATADENQNASYKTHLMRQVNAAIGSVMAFVAFQSDESSGGRQSGSLTIKRQRKDIEDYIGHINDRSFHRRYRMDKNTVWTLLEIVSPNLPSTGEGRKLGGVPNGPITHASPLSMALRYFAGGDPLEISDFHGVNDNKPLRSVWLIVDAIHQCRELNIVFPETHAEQPECAMRFKFKQKSSINIDCCIGAIDGMLVWMNKPTTTDQENIEFGPTKFFCGRNMKYGLNMMGVCDSRRRFTWVEVNMPGAASDFYAFDQSSLKKKLQTEGFLRPGYCLFGDNAYVNTPYMCVPWRNVSSGPKNGMNFFHLSLRINIECAFGMLVHRWGILRKPMPVNLTVHKISSLVLALCKLHNFCIDNGSDAVEGPSEMDLVNITMEGGLFMPRLDSSGAIMYGILKLRVA